MSRLSLSKRERGPRRGLTRAVGVAGAFVLVLPATAGLVKAAPSTPPWLDSSRSTDARVTSLLHAMTLAEKVGQMDQQLVDNVTTSAGNPTCGATGFGMPDPSCLKTVLVDNLTGSVLAGGTDNPPDTTGGGGPGNTGLDWANEYNAIQQYAVQHSRLHIPVIFGVDAVHGFGHPWQAPLLHPARGRMG